MIFYRIVNVAKRIYEKYICIFAQNICLMSRYVILLFLSGMFTASTAQKLSNQARVSIITCAPYEELYAAFGHSAMRITDPENKLDIVYNWGTFDYQTPYFYLKFGRGKLDYMLSVYEFNNFMRSYIREKRWVKEQILNLDSTDVQAVFDYAQNNALEENRYYRYDFFYDNCATRIKDILKTTLDDRFIIGTSGLPENTTLRDMLHLYLTDKQWTEFGIDAILGLPADIKATDETATFLPDYLLEVAAHSKIKTNNGDLKPLVAELKILYTPDNEPEKHKSGNMPAIVFWIVASLVGLLTIFELKKKRYFKQLDFALFFVLGLLGLLITLLWFATDHTATLNNFNILWAMPLHLIAVFMLVRNRARPILKNYFLIYGFITLIFTMVSPVLPQDIHAGASALALVGSIRALHIWNRLKNQSLI